MFPYFDHVVIYQIPAVAQEPSYEDKVSMMYQYKVISHIKHSERLKANKNNKSLPNIFPSSHLPSNRGGPERSSRRFNESTISAAKPISKQSRWTYAIHICHTWLILWMKALQYAGTFVILWRVPKRLLDATVSIPIVREFSRFRCDIRSWSYGSS